MKRHVVDKKVLGTIQQIEF